MTFRVLVTGGAGFVGSHIVDRTIEAGHEVLVVDDMSSGKAENLRGDLRLEELDISEAGFEKTATKFRPDLIVHCAAQKSVRASMRDPIKDAETNLLGGIRVCQSAISSGCNRLVYLATGGAMYGEAGQDPVDECYPISPQSAYGLSKWTLESYFQVLLPDTVRVAVLRLGNVYGPRQDPDGEAGVVAILGRSMMQGGTVSIFGDGEQTRDYIYVADVVQAYDLARKFQGSLTVNIGTGHGTSVNELFRLMAQETGYRSGPHFRPERPGELRHVVLDSSKARRLLGWEPRTGLSEGLSYTLAWIRTQL